MRILYHPKEKKYVFVKDINKDFHTKWGIISKEDLNKPIGSKVKTHRGEELILLKPSFRDRILKLKRGPQATHWKDIGMILGYLGITDGWRVIELGTGSGILTCYLANAIKPNGRVYSYENRREFYEIARRNLEEMGLINYVELKLKDVREGLDEKNVDLVISDIRDPWEVVDHVYNSLKIGGYFVALLPNILSVNLLLEKLENRFVIEFVGENIIREWIYKKNVLRPKNLQLVHTEFIIIGRKIRRD